MTTALVLIDLQVGIVAGKAQPRRQRTLDRAYDTVAARLGTVRRRAQEAQVPVIFVQHEDAEDPHLSAGSPGWQLRSEFVPEESERVVVKQACDAFYETTLLDGLSTLDISHLVIGGALTPFCIDTTVRRAVSHGFDVTLLADGQMSIDMGGWSYSQIIAHHNRILDGFSAGAHAVRLVRCADLTFSVAQKGAFDRSLRGRSRRAEAAGAARRLADSIDLGDGDLNDGRDDGLCDAHATLDHEGCLAEIDQQHLHLAAIIAVDGAGRVEAGDAVLEGKAGARADLHLKALGHLEDEAGRHQRALTRGKRHRRIGRNGGGKVHAGRTRRLVARQSEALAMRQAFQGKKRTGQGLGHRAISQAGGGPVNCIFGPKPVKTRPTHRI